MFDIEDYFFLIAICAGLLIGGYIALLTRRIEPGIHCSRYDTWLARIIAALALGAVIYFSEYSIEWIITIPFVISLIMVSLIDIKIRIIPDIVTIPTILFTLILRIWIHELPYWNYLVAAFVAAGIFYLIALISSMNGKESAVGGGDIKLLLLVGLVLGIKLTLLSFFLFSLIGFLFGLFILLRGEFRRNVIIPFGPFIAAGALISIVINGYLFSWFTSLLI